MGPWHSCQCKNLFSHSFSSRFVPLCLVSLSVIVSFFFSHPQPYQVLNPQSCSQLRWLSVSLTGMFPTFHFHQISMTIWTPTPAPGLFPRNLRQVRDRKQDQATTQLLVKQQYTSLLPKHHPDQGHETTLLKILEHYHLRNLEWNPNLLHFILEVSMLQFYNHLLREQQPR